MYTLNGLGNNGSIRGGKSSPERHLLLRREALELSLLTFRYADDVDMVVTILPPPPGRARRAGGGRPEAGAGAAVPAGRPAVASWPCRWRRPCRRSRRGPSRSTSATAEAKRLDALTLANQFIANFHQSQDASLFLVLER